MLRLRRVIAIFFAGTALSGCNPPPVSTPTAAPTVTSTHDGTYHGSVQLTYVAPMAQRAWCETPPQVTVQVINGSLTYSQPHPGYPDTPVIIYTATVTNDSKFVGTSNKGGTITGQIAGTHLTGTLDGVGCSYTVVADLT